MSHPTKVFFLRLLATPLELFPQFGSEKPRSRSEKLLGDGAGARRVRGAVVSPLVDGSFKGGRLSPRPWLPGCMFGVRLLARSGKFWGFVLS